MTGKLPQHKIHSGRWGQKAPNQRRPGRAGGSGGPPGVRALATTLNAALDQQRDAEDQLHQARDDLAGQQAYLTEVLNSISVAVLTCNADGTLREVNGVARAAQHGAIPVHVNDLHGIAEPGANLATAPHPLVRALHG
jgi:hypothetical protein